MFTLGLRKNRLTRSIALLGAIASVSLSAGAAQASQTIGIVTFLGTFPEEAAAGVFGARFRFRVNGTCDNDTVVKDRFIIVRAGRMDGAFAHNDNNSRNAYSTLLGAALAGKRVQVDGIANCSTTVPIDMPLWAGGIGVIVP